VSDVNLFTNTQNILISSIIVFVKFAVSSLRFQRISWQI